MMHFLVIKEQIKRIYQNTSIYADPVFRFLIAFGVFWVINDQLGFNPSLNSLPLVLGMSVICAFTPAAVLVFAAMAVMIGHVYAVSNVLAAFTAVILIIIYCLFAKFTPDFGYVVLAVPILYYLKVPYCVPILLGMISTPVSAVAVACGVVIYYLIGVIKGLNSATTGISVEDILNLYHTIIDTWLSNEDMIFAVFVFCAVVLVTYLIRKMEFNYAFEVAILAGGIVNILGFLIGNLGFDISVSLLQVTTGTLLSIVIVYIIWFFKLTLDHTAIERVQFEDDDYYYYVKAVPKMKITAPEKNVKKINEKKEIED